MGGLAACRGGESEKPPVHLIPNMDTQEKGRAYRRDTSGLFADGRVMRTPVEGTLARGELPTDPALEQGVEVDGGVATDVPAAKYPAAITVNEDFRARGKIRYEIYCTPCHGGEGDGKGPVAARGLAVPPANFHDARLKEMPVGKIYSAIKNGVNQGNMPSYAAQVPVADRWAIVSHVRAMQMARDPGMQEFVGAVVVAKSNKASAEYGAQLYKAKTCNACHSLDGTRVVGPTFKGLFGRQEDTSAGPVTVDEKYVRESILDPGAKIVNTYGPTMPKLQIDPIELDSLVLFLKAQK
jgi:mono/diheme cytochrome c family protein